MGILLFSVWSSVIQYMEVQRRESGQGLRRPILTPVFNVRLLPGVADTNFYTQLNAAVMLMPVKDRVT